MEAMMAIEAEQDLKMKNVEVKKEQGMEEEETACSSCASCHWAYRDQWVTLVTIGSACVPNQDAGHGLVAVPGHHPHFQHGLHYLQNGQHHHLQHETGKPGEEAKEAW
ncbi:hypothetical protein EMCRGX_G032943 [Ephydatia muelleri]